LRVKVLFGLRYQAFIGLILVQVGAFKHPIPSELLGA